MISGMGDAKGNGKGGFVLINGTTFQVTFLCLRGSRSLRQNIDVGGGDPSGFSRDVISVKKEDREDTTSDPEFVMLLDSMM